MKRIVAVLALIAPSVLAHEAGEPDAGWFNALARRDGGHCCGLADCRVAVKSWRMLGPHDGAAAEVTLMDGRTLRVDPDAVLERIANPTGRAVACVVGDVVMCLVRDDET